MRAIERFAKTLVWLPLAFILESPDASAWPSCTDIFSTTYPNSQTENLGSCRTCHQSSGGGGNYNLYGADLRANGASGAGGNCTNVDFAAALRAVEGLDSDSEGNTNIVEIQADTQPGWCDTTLNAGCTNSAGTPPNVALDPAPQPPDNNKPIANAGGPYAGEAGSTSVQFDGSGSSDADGDALTYAWDFGDQSSGTGMTPTHVYATVGTFQVALVVNDSHVDSDASFASAVITAPPMNVAPIANPGGPYDGQPGQAITFDGSASGDPNGDPLTYAWDFGDGSFGSGVAPMHTYAADGNYTVMLTVNDGQVDSAPTNTTVTITMVQPGDGAALYDAMCLGCHGDPWAGAAVDTALAGLRRVAGARSCNIEGSIFGTSVFPNGVPEMQFLQGLTNADIDALAEHLNSQATSGERRYVTTCAGCHGDDGSGGRVRENVLSDSASETLEAIREESEMRYLSCMPRSDIDEITVFLKGTNGGDVDDDDDERHSDEGGGSTGFPILMLLAGVALIRRLRLGGDV
jgi:PKD repeat protein